MLNVLVMSASVYFYWYSGAANHFMPMLSMAKIMIYDELMKSFSVCSTKPAYGGTIQSVLICCS